MPFFDPRENSEFKAYKYTSWGEVPQEKKKSEEVHWKTITDSQRKNMEIREQAGNAIMVAEHRQELHAASPKNKNRENHLRALQLHAFTGFCSSHKICSIQVNAEEYP